MSADFLLGSFVDRVEVKVGSGDGQPIIGPAITHFVNERSSCHIYFELDNCSVSITDCRIEHSSDNVNWTTYRKYPDSGKLTGEKFHAFSVESAGSGEKYPHIHIRLVFTPHVEGGSDAVAKLWAMIID
jgi:hypothetical protein